MTSWMENHSPECLNEDNNYNVITSVTTKKITFLIIKTKYADSRNFLTAQAYTRSETTFFNVRQTQQTILRTTYDARVSP